MARRTATFLAVLLLSASCAATGVGSSAADAGDSPREHEREVDRSEFRLLWPFTTGRGMLSCESGAITLQTAGVTYGLNDEAIARGFPSAVPILMTRHRPPTNPLGRLRQGDRERIFGVALSCDRAREPAKCQSGVRGQYGLSEAELEQILVEGRERTWPPLEPARASVEPILEAGRRLCQ